MDNVNTFDLNVDQPIQWFSTESCDYGKLQIGIGISLLNKQFIAIIDSISFQFDLRTFKDIFYLDSHSQLTCFQFKIRESE